MYKSRLAKIQLYDFTTSSWLYILAWLLTGGWWLVVIADPRILMEKGLLVRIPSLPLVFIVRNPLKRSIFLPCVQSDWRRNELLMYWCKSSCRMVRSSQNDIVICLGAQDSLWQVHYKIYPLPTPQGRAVTSFLQSKFVISHWTIKVMGYQPMEGTHQWTVHCHASSLRHTAISVV